MNNNKEVQSLFKDLFRFRTHNTWFPPELNENKNWFLARSQEEKTWFQEDLLLERVKELVEKGANLTKMSNIFINSKKVSLLNYAINNNLIKINEKNQLGNYPIERAIGRKIPKMAFELITNDKVDLTVRNKDGENVYFMLAENNMLNSFFKLMDNKKYDYLLYEVDNKNNSILDILNKNFDEMKKSDKAMAFTIVDKLIIDNLDFVRTNLKFKGDGKGRNELNILAYKLMLENELSLKDGVELNKVHKI